MHIRVPTSQEAPGMRICIRSYDKTTSRARQEAGLLPTYFNPNVCHYWLAQQCEAATTNLPTEISKAYFDTSIDL